MQLVDVKADVDGRGDCRRIGVRLAPRWILGDQLPNFVDWALGVGFVGYRWFVLALDPCVGWLGLLGSQNWCFFAALDSVDEFTGLQC